MDDVVTIDAVGHPTLLEIIQGAGLTANLKLCLDAGDGLSYASGQKWLDRSGGGYDFFLGDDGTANSADPTFNGEFFSVDGGDYFRYDTSNESWMNALHKDAATLTCLAAFYPASFGGTQSVFGTVGTNASDQGVALHISNVSGAPSWLVGNGATFVTDTGASVPNLNAWNILGLSVAENGGASGSFHYLNGSYNQVGGSDTFDAAVASAGAGNAAATMEIMARGNGVAPNLSGFRIAWLALWDTNLSKANLDALFSAARVRFGI